VRFVVEFSKVSVKLHLNYFLVTGQSDDSGHPEILARRHFSRKGDKVRRFRTNLKEHTRGIIERLNGEGFK